MNRIHTPNTHPGPPQREKPTPALPKGRVHGLESLTHNNPLQVRCLQGLFFDMFLPVGFPSLGEGVKKRIFSLLFIVVRLPSSSISKGITFRLRMAAGVVRRYTVVVEEVPLAFVLDDAVVGGPAYDGLGYNTLIGERVVRGCRPWRNKRKWPIAGGVGESSTCRSSCASMMASKKRCGSPAFSG